MDLDAEHYKNHSQQQYDRSKPLIAKNITSTNLDILDIGCGDGKTTAEMANLVPKGTVIGIDSSENMIKHALKTFGKLNLKFQCSKAEELEFDHFFDKIFCLSCLIWIRKPKEAIEKLSNLLKPGGSLIILTYLKESSYVDFLEKTLENFPSYKKSSAVHTMISAENHLNILKSCGLQIEIFEIHDDLACYSSKEDLKSYLKGWLNCYVSLPEELQNDFLKQAVENSLKFSVSKDKNLIKLPFKTLVIKANK